MPPSVFESVTQAPPDPILGVTDAFRADTHPEKLNLGVGAYRTEDLQPYVLQARRVVRKAEALMLAKNENKEYLAIEGLAPFVAATVSLMLGADSPAIKAGRVATVQRFLPGATAYVSDPTWGNHMNILADAGVKWAKYRYYDPKTVGLDFAGMVEDLTAAPDGSVIILHGCAHNPTGIDPTPAQWAALADLCAAKRHVPFFDIAYQGFASGSLDADAASIRLFVARGMEVFAAQSYSKNLGLYSERVGAFSVVAANAGAAGRVLSQLKRLARPMWSNPPVHGARIVAEIMADPAMFSLWKTEMEMMAGRIKAVRKTLHAELTAADPSRDWGYVLRQIGMFSFTGLAPHQVDHMTAKHHVYMTKDGRISLAGLNQAKCKMLAGAIVDSFAVKAKL